MSRLAVFACLLTMISPLSFLFTSLSTLFRQFTFDGMKTTCDQFKKNRFLAGRIFNNGIHQTEPRIFNNMYAPDSIIKKDDNYDPTYHYSMARNF